MLDPALRGFVDATSEEEAERRLETLLEQRVSPLIRKIVARKLSAHGGKNLFPSEDLEDVAGDATLILLRRLHALRMQPGASDIESLDDYTAAVAYSVCAHHLRRRHPARSRLKSRLRYVLGREPRFLLWEVEGLGLCCGFSRWHGQAPDRSAAERLTEVEQKPDRWPQSWKRPPFVDRADPGPMVGEIFERIAGPVELDRLVGLVASIWQIERGQQSGFDTVFERLADTPATPEIAIDRRRFLERLWIEIQQLPVRQRVALLLNLRDSQGAGMLWIFPVIGVASLRAIAGALEVSVEELAGLWGRLPVDDTVLAERLGCTRQQVINLRMSARKRLSNRLGTPYAPIGAVGQQQTNLSGLSTSLGMRRE